MHERFSCAFEVSVSLSSGTAAALSAAREEVDQQLSGSFSERKMGVSSTKGEVMFGTQMDNKPEGPAQRTNKLEKCLKLRGCLEIETLHSFVEFPAVMEFVQGFVYLTCPRLSYKHPELHD